MQTRVILTNRTDCSPGVDTYWLTCYRLNNAPKPNVFDDDHLLILSDLIILDNIRQLYKLANEHPSRIFYVEFPNDVTLSKPDFAHLFRTAEIHTPKNICFDKQITWWMKSTKRAHFQSKEN